LWGGTVGAMTSSPQCLHSIAESEAKESVLRRELSRVIIQHNPNRALEAMQREQAKQGRGEGQ
jgi:hypothetical protein